MALVQFLVLALVLADGLVLNIVLALALEKVLKLVLDRSETCSRAGSGNIYVAGS